MPYANHPSPSDLMKFWDGTGIVCDWVVEPFASIDLVGKINSAIAIMESETSRKFIATIGTRTFDPPTNVNGFLSIGGDLCSDPQYASSIVVTFSGTPMEINRNCFLGPENSDYEGQPWSLIEFDHFVPAIRQRRCISVTGYWGFSRQVPDDVWQAELSTAALLMAPEVELAITNGQAKIEDVTFASGSFTPLSSQMAQWQKTFDSVVANKKRVVF